MGALVGHSVLHVGRRGRLGRARAIASGCKTALLTNARLACGVGLLCGVDGVEWVGGDVFVHEWKQRLMQRPPTHQPTPTNTAVCTSRALS